jgi:branched-chain amino acid transport system substrate-binding protein
LRARWLGLAALAAAATAALGGCGGVGSADTTEAAGSQLAIYSSLPLQGPEAQASEQIVNGEKLALADARGRAGDFKVGYLSLDDANPTTGQWSPGVTATNAKTAADDTSTIAYLGDYDSGATAVSLPLINAAGILQLSPASPYVGLTSSLDAGQDEPERFYPTGRRTFARLQPGDPAQAVAQAQLMGLLGVHSVYVLDDQGAFEMPLADIVAREAGRAGIRSWPMTVSPQRLVRRLPARSKRSQKATPRRCSSRAPPGRARPRCGASCTTPTPSCCCWVQAIWQAKRSPTTSARPRPTRT